MPWSTADADQLDPGTEAPLNQTTIGVRRARLRGEGVRDDFRATVEVDGGTLGGAHLRLLAADVGWGHRWGTTRALTVRAGLLTIPFGAEVMRPELSRDFLEATTATRALFPGLRDGGVRVDGEFRALRASVAIMNGAPVGDAQWQGVDPSASHDVIGRLGVELGGCGWQVRAGASALVGDGLDPGAPPTKDELQWVDANENGLVEITELQVVDGDPGRPTQAYAHRALGADAQVRWRALWIGWGQADAEVVVATDLDRGVAPANPITLGRPQRGLGWQIGAVQALTPWLQVGVRIDRYQADRDASETLGAAQVRTDPTWTTVSAVATVRWHDAALSLGYDHGDNPLGRTLDGSITSQTDQRVIVRGQWAP